MPDGRSVVERDRMVTRDPINQVVQVELIYHVTHLDGRVERLVHAFPLRYFFRFEAEHLLERAGFRVEDVFADFDRTPYGAKHPSELILVARKA
jgi:hypothetical protein